METAAKHPLIISVVFAVLLFSSSYYLINYYFEKQVQYRSFEECLSVVNDPMASWMTRKGTIDYCKAETR